MSATLGTMVDLWDRERDEVLLGLLSRQFQLVAILLADVSLWMIEAGSHYVRHLAENLITVRYLNKHGDLFQKFVEHGMGQLKLYKLHLQSEEESREFENAELSEAIDALEAQIGGEIDEELISITLGSWAGTNLRNMAKDIGMKELYDLVYQPQSIHAHGTWASLQTRSMIRCKNPLHRFHPVPHFGPTPVDWNVPFIALDMFEQLASEVAHIIGISIDTSSAHDYRRAFSVLFNQAGG